MTSTTPLRISRLRVPTDDELSPSVAAVFAQTEKQSGFIPNWLRGFALDEGHSERLNAYLFPLVQGDPAVPSSLTRREREILATVVSVRNGCAYCHALHVHELAEFLGDAWLAHRISLDHREVPELSDREHALIELALTVTDEPGGVSDAEIDALRGFGLSDADIFEAVQITSVFNATNRISLALGLLPDPEIFDGDHAGAHT
ncbi:peroxidase-related enzyme [Gordonia bronchialis]|uniref:peroxidase-related enzyme n=1 Tax=Gordonia bronchialis TaxID=2054 RepID=UPI001CBBA5A6|nr:peroxidase-related enzyme [Gordonia bronchialis]UAK37092.1 peroxidase-related enzyme [Gordonia bronchialis]